MVGKTRIEPLDGFYTHTKKCNQRDYFVDLMTIKLGHWRSVLARTSSRLHGYNIYQGDRER